MIHKLRFVILLVVLFIQATVAYSFDQFSYINVGETKTFYLPSEVTSKNIYASYWMVDYDQYVEIVSSTSTSVTVKGLKACTWSVNVRYEYYYMENNYSANDIHSIRLDVYEDYSGGSEEASEGPDSWSSRDVNFDKGCLGTINLDIGDTYTIRNPFGVSEEFESRVQWYKWGYPIGEGDSLVDILLKKDDWCLIGGHCVGQSRLYCLMKFGNSTYQGYYNINYSTTYITSITLNTKTVTLDVGESYQLSSTILPNNASNKVVKWTSDNLNVATVSKDGLVEATGAGTAHIKCTADDGSGKYATCTVTVKSSQTKVSSISITPTSATLNIGDTKQLSATVYPADATDKTVTWKSGNTNVATVTSTGLVTAKAEGSATITCTANDGSGVSATCKITVNSSQTYASSISITPKTVYIYVGSTKQLSATIYPENATEKVITWSSSNPSIATVNSTGLVTAKSPGSATITGTVNSAQTIIWQGEETGGAWSGALLFCAGQTNEGILPWLDDNTYDWMVGKKLSLDIKEAEPGATLRITTGWWSINLCDDIPIESAPCKIQFEMTQEFVDACKTQHLLFTGNGSYTITKFYYEQNISANCNITVIKDNSNTTVTTSSAGYATFYDSNSAYTLPSGLSAQVVTDCADGKLTYKTIADGSVSGSVIPKGTAVMLVNEKKTSGTFTLTESKSSSTYTGINYLSGSDFNTTTTASGNNYYYKLSYGNRGSELQNVFGWYWGNPSGAAFQIEAHKAWLAIPKSGTRALSFDAEGEANGIYEIPEDEESVYYDLQGRPLSRIKSKGIYIINGRKVIIK